MSSEWTESTDSEAAPQSSPADAGELSPADAERAARDADAFAAGPPSPAATLAEPDLPAHDETPSAETATEAEDPTVDADGDIPEEVDPSRRSRTNSPSTRLVRRAHLRRLRAAGQGQLENRIISSTWRTTFEAQVPMEQVTEIKNGQKKVVERVRYTGYVLVRMELTDTPGVRCGTPRCHRSSATRTSRCRCPSTRSLACSSPGTRDRCRGGCGRRNVRGARHRGDRRRLRGRRVGHYRGRSFETLAATIPRSTLTPASRPRLDLRPET